MRRTQIAVIISALFLSGGIAICYVGTDPGGSSAGEPSRQQRQLEPPPPPPALAPENEIAVPKQEEPPRKLSARAMRDLEQLIGVLPPHSDVLRYPSSPGFDQLAVVSADLESTGHKRSVVAYREPEVTPLSLSVVEFEGLSRIVATARLAGSNHVGIINGQVAPLSVVDVSGDGVLEILAVSGTGASAGSVLQIFVLEGSSLRVVGEISGHYFEVARSKGKTPTVVRARYQDESAWRQLAWSGRNFDEMH